MLINEARFMFSGGLEFLLPFFVFIVRILPGKYLLSRIKVLSRSIEIDCGMKLAESIHRLVLIFNADCHPTLYLIKLMSR